MGGAYFESYHPGKFQNQKVLCRILQNYAPHYQIETDDSNPMTIRLLVAHDFLAKITQITSKLSQAQVISSNNLHDRVYVSGALQRDIIVFPMQERQALNMVEIHKGLFGFFSNLCTALDRMAFEIGILYDFKEVRYKIDWNYFFGSEAKVNISLLAHYAKIPVIQ